MPKRLPSGSTVTRSTSGSKRAHNQEMTAVSLPDTPCSDVKRAKSAPVCYKQLPLGKFS